MNIFVTYTNEAYIKTRKFAAKKAKTRGHFDKVIEYEPSDIDREFFLENEEILTTRRGNGLWLWKPYFVVKALKEANDGDVVFYCDAGSYFIRDAKNIINTMEDDIWVSDIPLLEKQYTKPDVFIALDCVADEYLNSNQIQGNFIALRKSERSLKFAEEWLKLCTCKENMDMESNYPALCESNSFIAHRSDQSVLSLLSKKWNIKPHLDPTQFGRIPELYRFKDAVNLPTKHENEYKVCLILHRNKDANPIVRFKRSVYAWLPKFVVYGFLVKERFQ